MAIVIVSKEEQALQLARKELECHTLQIADIRNGTLSACPRVWDGVLCWPPTNNNVTVSLPCPDYVNGFNVDVNATRRCDHDGTWWVNPAVNDSWTNLTSCYPGTDFQETYSVPEIIAKHMGRIRLMYNIGYGVSLVSLILAVVLMLFFKRLHCPRIVIHINLFVSFILRAVISFVKDNALVNGVGFPADVEITADGTTAFLDNGSHWQCKTFFSVFNYILGANYMWILTEGIYLHLLITVAMFSERSGIKKLIVFGWGAPVVFVIPWVIVRATLEDVLCWNTHPTEGYFWMIRGPIVAAMGINFIIFLNIIRVLFTKLNAFKTPDVKRYRYRKLAKSTLVLIPLFGVHYIVFIGLPKKVDATTELVKLYYEMFFNSFQGFFVSLLFCFLNGEVQNEVRKSWRRFNLKHGNIGLGSRATRDTMTSFVSQIPVENRKQNGGPCGNHRDKYSVSDPGDHCDINGFISAQEKDGESQPMIMLSDANGIDTIQDSQPILNIKMDANELG